jgi:ribosomal protein S13
MQTALEDCWMKAESIDVNQLVTINDHLQALVTAEDVIASINSQLENVIDNEYGWRHRANVALKWQNTRKRITARLAVLRQLERERNIERQKSRDELLIRALRNEVSAEIFAAAVSL